MKAMTRTPIRCTICRREFISEDVKPGRGCPMCGTAQPPQYVAQDVQPPLNWLDYSNLCDLALKAAVDMGRQDFVERVQALIRVIEPYRPLGASALTSAKRKEEKALEQEAPVQEQNQKIVIPGPAMRRH